jgi:hypothetical protein
MSPLEQLIRISENLARSLGHKIGCAKASVPCNCRCSATQATALDEYQKWKMDHRERNIPPEAGEAR